MNIYNDYDDNGSDNGSKEKFNERLKTAKYRKGKYNDEEDDKKSISLFRNIFKIFLALPSVVYTNVITKNKDIDKNNDNLTSDVDNISNDKINSNDSKMYNGINFSNNIVDSSMYIKNVHKLDNYNKIKGINTRSYMSINKVSNLIKNSDLVISDELLCEKEKLQREIINLIKKRLVECVNELEIYESEFYLLSELGCDIKYLDECKKDIKEVKRLLSKINSLKVKYNYLKDNVDFQYMIEYNDDLLVDKILELKRLYDDNDILHLVEEYKLLDEYKYLYLKIDKLEDKMLKFDSVKNDEIISVKNKGIDYDRVKREVVNLDRLDSEYDKFVMEQDMFLNKLNEKLGKIDSHEVASYKLKGFSQLVSNSFKYLGLLLVNPLKGFAPSIVSQTIATKNIIHNLYNNLEWEEKRSIVYECVDYSSCIKDTMTNFDSMDKLMDSTLEDIQSLKLRFKNEFEVYKDNMSNYNDILKKLNKIENSVVGNKIKISKMMLNLRDKDKENNDKVNLVKKLNMKSDNI